MRIATWNVESLRSLTPARETAFHQAMATVDADVWVLTETWTNFSPGAGYALAAESETATDLIRQPTRRWVSIWRKSSLAATRLSLRAQADRQACCRIQFADGNPVTVVGTVLPWNGDKRWPTANDFRDAVSEQAESWVELQRGSPDCSLVIAGDLNQSLPYAMYFGSRVGETALSSALNRLNLTCLTQGDCSHLVRPRIDHICIERSGFESQSPVGGWDIPTVNGKGVTDHEGVFADLAPRSPA